MRPSEKRILQDLATITTEVMMMMAEAGLMMREAVMIALQRHGYESADGGGSPWLAAHAGAKVCVYPPK